MRVGLTVAAALGAVAVVVGLVLVPALAESPEDDVRETAQQLIHAIDHGDGAKACSTFAHPQRVADGQRSCPEVVEDALSGTAEDRLRVDDVRVSGDEAVAEVRGEEEGSRRHWKFIKREDGWKYAGASVKDNVR